MLEGLLTQDIRPVSEWADGPRLRVPDQPGLYAFWWLGPRQQLLDSRRQITLVGPLGREACEVEFSDSHFDAAPYPCLYVGKSTRLSKRLRLHLKRGSPGRLHTTHLSNHKVKPVTTSCQLRWGIKHIFEDEPEPLDMIFSNVGYSFTVEADMVERFY